MVKRTMGWAAVVAGLAALLLATAGAGTAPRPGIVVVVTRPPVEPPSYAEQAPPAAQYWYCCQNPAGYYPQVPQCPGGWIQVAPRSQ